MQLVCFPEQHGGAPLTGSLSYLAQNWSPSLTAQPHPWGLLAGLVPVMLVWGQNLQVVSYLALRLVFPPARLLYDEIWELIH